MGTELGRAAVFRIRMLRLNPQLLPFLISLLLIQSLSGGSNSWFSATHMGDLNGVWAPGFGLIQSLLLLAFGRVNQQVEELTITLAVNYLFNKMGDE